MQQAEFEAIKTEAYSRFADATVRMGEDEIIHVYLFPTGVFESRSNPLSTMTTSETFFGDNDQDGVAELYRDLIARRAAK